MCFISVETVATILWIVTTNQEVCRYGAATYMKHTLTIANYPPKYARFTTGSFAISCGAPERTTLPVSNT